MSIALTLCHTGHPCSACWGGHQGTGILNKGLAKGKKAFSYQVDLEKVFDILVYSLQTFHNVNTVGSILVKGETLEAGTPVHDVLQKSRQELTGEV